MLLDISTQSGKVNSQKIIIVPTTGKNASDILDAWGG